MPTYEYRCSNGHGFEEFFLKISDAKSVLPCPTCGLPGERHLSAGAGLVFKGSGFYITDYGKDGKKDLRAAKSDAARAEAARVDTGKGAAATGDAGKGDGAKGDAAKGDAGAHDAAKSDAGKGHADKSESRSKDAARSEPVTSEKPAPKAKSDGAPGKPTPTKSSSE